MTTPLNTDEILQGRDIQQIFRLWGEQCETQGFNELPIVNRLSDIFAEDAETFAGKFLDPFEKMHPSVANPYDKSIKPLKLVIRQYNFLYLLGLIKDHFPKRCFTQELIIKNLDIIEFEAAKVFCYGSKMYDNLTCIYSWAEDGIEPLQCLATGLLAVAMKNSKISGAFCELNLRLIPKMLKRIQILQAVYKSRDRDTYKQLSSAIPLSSLTERDFNKSDETNEIHNIINEFSKETLVGSTSLMSISAASNVIHLNGTVADNNGDIQATSTNNNDNNNVCSAEDSSNIINDDFTAATVNGNANISAAPNNLSINILSNSSILIKNENSRDASTPKNLIKSIIPIYPASIQASQIFILRYLNVMGEYQEFSGLIFEYNVIQLILSYIENVNPRDKCLECEALKYLSLLLCHKKFASEFISHRGFEVLLKMPVSTSVLVSFCHLACCEDAMERICSMSTKIISEFVSYGLSFLGSERDLAKCNAILYLGLGFKFKVILDEFDNQDGLRKICNVICTRHVYYSKNFGKGKNSQKLFERVCVTLKLYMESHLFFKYHQMRQYSVSKKNNFTIQQIGDQIRYLQENTPVDMDWAPVDQLLKLGVVKLLLPIVGYAYDCCNRSESLILRSVLDVLSVCCVKPKVYLAICDSLEGKLLAGILDPDIYKFNVDKNVQKSALALLIHIVCAPLSRPLSENRFVSLVEEKITNRHAEVLFEKVWKNVCSNNGIFILLQLLQNKRELTDDDCILGMACQALAGLVRSERLKQIISKLPLFANGQKQYLMRHPKLQIKHVEYVAFQKYALELLDLLVPHKCPNRVINSTFDYNLTARLFKAQAGYNTMRLDRHYVHQQFSPIKIIRSQGDSDYEFSCCDFLSNETTIIAGTRSGKANLYNINNSVEYTTQCHNRSLKSIKCNRTYNLVLTTTAWSSPFSILWSLDNNNRKLISKLHFNQDIYMEFSNLRQDKILGTTLETARIYDLNTGQKICAFEPKISNHYVENRATFCPTDDLILSDGVLWDVRSGQEIHKFDKLSQASGIFHPNNLEIISNTEIWDIRTFHLLQTVSALDECLIKFSPLNTIYCVSLNSGYDGFDSTKNSMTSFKILDSYDYSSISTIDVKSKIHDLNISKSGGYIISCETADGFDARVQELSSIKVYAV